MSPNTVDSTWFGRYVRRSITSAGVAFCILFSLSFTALVVYQHIRGAWGKQGLVTVLAEISGASFGMVIIVLTIGGALIMLERILLGDGRVREAREQGRRAERQLAIRADRDRKQGESIEQAMDRLRRESPDHSHS